MIKYHLANIICFILTLFFIVFIVVSAPAHSHSWYDKECCNDQDCDEVTNTVELPNGDLEVTTRFGVALVPKKFPRKPSQDNKEHACMIPSYGADGWEMQQEPSKYKHFIICYYVPLGS